SVKPLIDPAQLCPKPSGPVKFEDTASRFFGVLPLLALHRARLVVALLLCSVALVLGCVVYPALAPAGSPRPRQNVLIVIADDMRSDGLWVMRSLNRLAERAILFTRYYDTTPLCCPSRATLLTGLYSHDHGVLANSPPQGGVEAFDDRSTLATWAQASGTRTGLVGRYLNGYASTDIPPGWDSGFAIWQATEGHGNYYDYRANDNGNRRYFGSRPENYSTRVIGQQ